MIVYLMRYSNRSFFSKSEESPQISSMKVMLMWVRLVHPIPIKVSDEAFKRVKNVEAERNYTLLLEHGMANQMQKCSSTTIRAIFVISKCSSLGNFKGEILKQNQPKIVSIIAEFEESGLSPYIIAIVLVMWAFESGVEYKMWT
ncbi:hypothetical protein VNO77_12376 [Canavalia gladiata]|uniref:Uncharacterized protein n=1 Tax=Canavalia gladiata TaxID=3824 RepID=A0AAN9LW80_CANGL